MKEINQGVTHQPQLAYDLSPRGSITYTSRGGIVETTPIIPEISSSEVLGEETRIIGKIIGDGYARLIVGFITDAESGESTLAPYKKIELDGVEIEVHDIMDASIVLPLGEHTIIYTLEDTTTIPSNLLPEQFFSNIILPSCITTIEGVLFNNGGVTSITCLAMTAPTLEYDYCFYNLSYQNGTLYVPEGATGYDAWLEQLGSGWNIVYIQDGWDPYAGDDFFVRLVVLDYESNIPVGNARGIEIPGSGIFTRDHVTQYITPYNVDQETGDSYYTTAIALITGTRCTGISSMLPHGDSDEFAVMLLLLRTVVISDTVNYIEDRAFAWYVNLSQASVDAIKAVNPNAMESEPEGI